MLLESGFTPSFGICGKPVLQPWSTATWIQVQSGQTDPLRTGPGKILFRVYTRLSGWWFQPLRKILVSWEYYSQNMEK